MWGEGDIEQLFLLPNRGRFDFRSASDQKDCGATLLGLNETKVMLFASPDDLSKLGMSRKASL